MTEQQDYYKTLHIYFYGYYNPATKDLKMLAVTKCKKYIISKEYLIAQEVQVNHQSAGMLSFIVMKLNELQEKHPNHKIILHIEDYYLTIVQQKVKEWFFNKVNQSFIFIKSLDLSSKETVKYKKLVKSYKEQTND